MHPRAYGDGTETSAIKHHTPQNNPKGYTRHTEHGESLKSSKISMSYMLLHATYRELISYWNIRKSNSLNVLHVSGPRN
jgi:hypothetical protein